MGGERFLPRFGGGTGRSLNCRTKWWRAGFSEADFRRRSVGEDWMKKSLVGILIILGVVLAVVAFGDGDPYKYTFTATIEDIVQYNGHTTVLVNAEEGEDSSFSGEYDFSVDQDTKLIRNGRDVKVSELEIGQKVLIVGSGDIMERYPAGLSKVLEVEILESVIKIAPRAGALFFS